LVLKQIQAFFLAFWIFYLFDHHYRWALMHATLYATSRDCRIYISFRRKYVLWGY
jgi:hypothetical protein